MRTLLSPLSSSWSQADITDSLVSLFPSVPIIFTNPAARAGYDTRSIFKRGLTGFNSEFSFSETSCLTKAEEPSLSYYLPIAGGRIIRFIPFPRVLVLCEMQSVSSRIWTRVAVSNSYDDNHYTTGTSIRPYRPSLLVGLLDCIQCPHRADVFACRSSLVCPWVGVQKRMLLMSSSLLLDWFARWEMSDHTVDVLRDHHHHHHHHVV